MKKRILIVNGPNLNLLGVREPDIYGLESFDDILARLRKEFPDVEFDYFQSNCEGALIDRLQKAGFEEKFDGVVLNAGGYSHTSVALADAVAAIPVKVVEVHISNVFSREAFRHRSVIAGACAGLIAGFGADSYRLATLAFI